MFEMHLNSLLLKTQRDIQEKKMTISANTKLMIYLTLLIAKSDWCCFIGIYYNSSSDSITKNLINNITESDR